MSSRDDTFMSEKGWMYEDIKFYTDLILSSTEIGKGGTVYWDRDLKNNQGLSGFSHGASGIGFVFFELFRLSANPSFKQICQLAFKFEDYSYDVDTDNWLDHRRFPYNEADQEEFFSSIKSNSKDLYTVKKSMMAWCHGSPGIILARNHADYTGDVDIRHSIKHIQRNLAHITNHTLCHSAVGNALCLMLTENHVADSTELHTAIFVLCKKLLWYYNKNGTFLCPHSDQSYSQSLFMGNLGVFYFLVNVYKYLNHIEIKENILNPSIPLNKPDPKIKEIFKNYNIQYMAELLAEKSYPRTSHLLKISSIPYPRLTIDFRQVLKHFVTHLEDVKIKDAFRYEETLLNFRTAIDSYSYINFKTITDIQELARYDTVASGLRVKINPDMEVHKFQWNWGWRDNSDHNQQIQNLQEEPGNVIMALYPNTDSFTLALNDFAQHLIDYVSDRESVHASEIITYFVPMFSSNESQAERASALLFQNIQFYIKRGILHIVY